MNLPLVILFTVLQIYPDFWAYQSYQKTARHYLWDESSQPRIFQDAYGDPVCFAAGQNTGYCAGTNGNPDSVWRWSEPNGSWRTVNYQVWNEQRPGGWGARWERETWQSPDKFLNWANNDAYPTLQDCFNQTNRGAQWAGYANIPQWTAFSMYVPGFGCSWVWDGDSGTYVATNQLEDWSTIGSELRQTRCEAYFANHPTAKAICNESPSAGTFSNRYSLGNTWGCEFLVVTWNNAGNARNYFRNDSILWSTYTNPDQYINVAPDNDTWWRAHCDSRSSDKSIAAWFIYDGCYKLDEQMYCDPMIPETTYKYYFPAIFGGGCIYNCP